MAGKKRKKTTEDLSPQPDPRAPLDGAAFLKAAKQVLGELDEDLLARADGSPGVTRALKQRHAQERKEQRTADGYEVWRRQVVVQIGAAWLLSCVFVRTLEDRGLLGRNRIAGPGARDGQQMYFQLAPFLTERDYLLTVFREMSHIDAVRGLFARERSLVWKLAPSAAGAKRLLELFRVGDAEAPAFRFGQADTRFLGDLYQDLNDDVKARFALLQTPDFVEEFILDRTLEPALEKFGLERTDLIDPTCGSGHFLLGAFGRLFDRRLREEPGIDTTTAAKKALDAVYGVDINPYAVAIARFRLTLAFLEKAGFTKLDGAPVVEPNVVVADSLLHNFSATGAGNVAAQVELGDALGQDAAVWKGEEFRLEDEAGVKRVLGKAYAAVVGNPPYITVKDAVLRERYRGMYPRSAAGKYSVAAPFTERFFQLGRVGGRVGMITANSFMKREFGKKLIEEYLPTVNLDAIVNTSGAYIPGHGTPTVLLFGSHEEAQSGEVLTVLANRGEPSTPEDPRKGEVWGSIAGHWNEVGFENEYVTVMRIERGKLGGHPWSLGGGGATELKDLLEERAAQRLGDIAEDIGFASFTGLDDAFIIPRAAGRTLGIEDDVLRDMVVGEDVRDWSIHAGDVAITPYEKEVHEPIPLAPKSNWGQFLWRYRTVANNVSSFGGKTRADEGQSWWTWYRWQAERYKAPYRITFAFVATHNHFVLDRGGKVFKQSAPIIKLPETATEDDHFALLAYLNSSTACFWMKQVFFEKSSQNYVGDVKDKPERIHYEFAGTPLKQIPLPPDLSGLAALGKACDGLAGDRSQLVPSVIVSRWQKEGRREDLARLLRSAEREERRARNLLVALQEEVDWAVYARFGLCDLAAAESQRACSLNPEERPGLAPESVPPDLLSAAEQAVWKERWAASRRKPLSNIEQPLYKRPWLGVQGVFHRDERSYADQAAVALADALLCEVESGFMRETHCLRDLITGADGPSAAGQILEISSELGFRLELPALIERDSVPFSPRFYLTPTGLDKHSAWKMMWDLQRQEDAAENVGHIPVAPKYNPKDFVDQREYSLRGKLDVPKERFISYPGCESDNDPSPVYGWAGWDHAQRAQALAQLYLARKTEENWSAERLTPMLAGLDELIFWLELWHAEPHPDYGIPLASFYTDFIDTECRELGLTLDDLRNWRPPKGFGKPKKAAKKKSTASKPAGNKPRGKKKASAESDDDQGPS